MIQVKKLNGELFLLCREQLIEIRSQRLLANGWTTYSLGETNSLLDIREETCYGYHELSEDQTFSSQVEKEKLSFITNHRPCSDKKIDDLFRSDGFVPCLLKRYFELTTAGHVKEDVRNRSSAICQHGSDQITCHLDNIFPLYCIVLIHLTAGAGPLIYPRKRLGRSLSTSREEMLATSWGPDGAAPLPSTVTRELRERFGFIFQHSPGELMAEMEGPGCREVGDVTIISSDMLHCLPSRANLALEGGGADSCDLSTAPRKRSRDDWCDTSKTDQFCGASSKRAVEPPYSLPTSDFHESGSGSLATPPPATQYAYTIYQPESEASLPPTYILNSGSSSLIRFDPPTLHKVLAADSRQPFHALSSEWKDCSK